MRKIIFIFPIIYIFMVCTPYNSDKVNTELIQGKWQLIDTKNHKDKLNTVQIDYSEEFTYLIFDGNKCIQYMPDLADTLNLTFSIHDYKLTLYKDSIYINKLSIDSLSSEKLVLSQEYSEHIYKKIKQY